MQTDTGVDLDALGQAMNTSWGNSSTRVAATFSVKAKLARDNMVQVDYLSTLTYAEGTPMYAVMKKYDAESESAINGTLKQIKEDYRNIAGKSLKMKRVGDPTSSIEPVSMSAYSPIRRGYYRRRVMYELG